MSITDELEKIIPPNDLEQCIICGRRFTLDRIEAHETICQNSKRRNRKAFDITRQRIGESEAGQFYKEPKTNTQIKTKCNKSAHCFDCPQKKRTVRLNTNWLSRHEDFIKKVREAKERSLESKKEKINELPPLSIKTNDYFQCPHCSRKFNMPFANIHITCCSKCESLQKEEFLEDQQKTCHIRN